MAQEEERLKLASLKKKKTFKNIIFLGVSGRRRREQQEECWARSQGFLRLQRKKINK